MKKKEDKKQLLEQTVSARQETREGLVLLSWAQQGPEPRQGQNGHGAQWEGQKSPRQAGRPGSRGSPAARGRSHPAGAVPPASGHVLPAGQLCPRAPGFLPESGLYQQDNGPWWLLSPAPSPASPVKWGQSLTDLCDLYGRYAQSFRKPPLLPMPSRDAVCEVSA